MKKVLFSISIVCSFLLLSNARAFSQQMNSDDATLIVYRDGFLYGAWKNFDVKIDGQKRDKLKKNKSMHTYQLAAGNHRVAPGDEDKAVSLNMSAGTTYVVEYRVRFGLLGAVPKLDIKTVAEGKKDSKLVRQHMMKEDEMMKDDHMEKDDSMKQ